MMTKQKSSTWRVDQNHSQVQFKVKHLAISNVAGTFKIFSGEVKSDDNDFTNASIHFEIDVNSLDTNNKERDEHLRSQGFFNVAEFPKILFDGLLKKNDDAYMLEGDLTIGKATNKIQMDVDYTGTGAGRFNDVRAGFEVNGKIKRSDYNLRWNVLTEAGGLVIGEDIKLHFDIQLIRQ